MRRAASVSVTRAEHVRRAYRLAFEEFARRVREVQRLTERAGPQRAELDAALVALENARLHYNQCRDILAEELQQRPKAEAPELALELIS